MPADIPDKVYFRIGEVSEIVGVEPHVLRYWETEFPQIKPNRAVSSQRLYRRRDLECFLEIKRLLYEEEYTVSGARKKLSLGDKASKGIDSDREELLLTHIRNRLTEIRKLLEDR